eukprot:scaffold54482_cov22-Tisochrysis_lutea.AAC.1
MPPLLAMVPTAPRRNVLTYVTQITCHSHRIAFCLRPPYDLRSDAASAMCVAPCVWYHVRCRLGNVCGTPCVWHLMTFALMQCLGTQFCGNFCLWGGHSLYIRHSKTLDNRIIVHQTPQPALLQPWQCSHHHQLLWLPWSFWGYSLHQAPQQPLSCSLGTVTAVTLVAVVVLVPLPISGTTTAVLLQSGHCNSVALVSQSAFTPRSVLCCIHATVPLPTPSVVEGNYSSFELICLLFLNWCRETMMEPCPCSCRQTRLCCLLSCRGAAGAQGDLTASAKLPLWADTGM